MVTGVEKQVEVMWVSEGAECLKNLTLGSRDHW